MKKNLMKKVFAVTLSVAMACSMIQATNPVTASAAASVKLKTARKTLQVGDKYKLTLKNNTKKWKVVKATSKAPSIAKVYKTTKKAVKVKGKSEGKAVVKVRLKSAQTKKVKNLKCTFTVVDNSTPTPTPEPTPDPTPVQTDATVKTQEELDAALADSNITKITVDTEEEANFVIKEGTYSTVDLTVNAPKADVENNATFKSITIQAIKDETWTENAKGNALKILAKIARIIVGKDAVVSSMDFAGADADIKLEVNGSVTNATVSAKVKLAITGESKTPIKLNVASSAKDAEVTSGVPVDVEVNADMKLNLTKGAENSKVELKAAGLNIELDNKTDSDVDITMPSGAKETVRKGYSKKVSSPASGTTTTPGGNTGTSNPVVNKVAYTGAGIDLTNVVICTGASITVETGVALTSSYEVNITSGATLRFMVKGAKEVSGAAIECKATVKTPEGNRYLGWQDCTNGTWFSVTNIKEYSGDYTIELIFRVKATATTLAGENEEMSGVFNISVPVLTAVEWSHNGSSSEYGKSYAATKAQVVAGGPTVWVEAD